MSCTLSFGLSPCPVLFLLDLFCFISRCPRQKPKPLGTHQRCLLTTAPHENAGSVVWNLGDQTALRATEENLSASPFCHSPILTLIRIYTKATHSQELPGKRQSMKWSLRINFSPSLTAILHGPTFLAPGGLDTSSCSYLSINFWNIFPLRLSQISSIYG